MGTDKDLTPLINYLNANIKRYKEQVMTRAKKKDDDKTPPAEKKDDDTPHAGCPQASASSADGR